MSLKVREMSRNCQGEKSCHGKLHMRTEDCVTFIIFNYSVDVDGTGFYEVIVIEYELDSLIADFNTSSTGVV